MNEVERHNQTIINNLRVGDLVQFQRGLYSHWAVYVGRGEVVHLSGDGNDGFDAKFRPEHVFTISGKTFNKASVCIDKLTDVILGSKILINNTKDTKLGALHPEEIVKNAMSRVGRVGYSVITKNCEHFAKWCRYGVEQSDQVDSVMTGVAVGVAMGAAIGLVKAITSYWAPTAQTEQEEEDD